MSPAERKAIFEYPHIWVQHPLYGLLKREISSSWTMHHIRYYDAHGIARFHKESESLNEMIKAAEKWLNEECTLPSP